VRVSVVYNRDGERRLTEIYRLDRDRATGFVGPSAFSGQHTANSGDIN
jgi:hypothetical protein